MNSELAHALIPGTDEDVAARYARLAERARTQRFGLIEPEYVVLDTETTGFSPERDALIEIAAAIVSGTEILDRFFTFVNPERPIPPIITELTSITDDDVCNAPLAHEAVEALAEFVGSRRIIAHNASFDQAFIQANASATLPKNIPLLSDDPWIDTLEMARIALPRLRVHNLETLSAAFSPQAPSSHRAIDDVEALCHLWRVLLVAISDLPRGLPHYIAGRFENVAWGAREVFSMIALDQAQLYGAQEAKDLRFSLAEIRSERMKAFKKQEKIDAVELDGGILGLDPVSRDELEAAFTSTGSVGSMYSGYEPRAEQVEMACEVADGLNSSTYRAIEAGTGVGKSMAYLLPLAQFAKRNRVICGVATKTNALLDQLVYQELPRLAKTFNGIDGTQGNTQSNGQNNGQNNGQGNTQASSTNNGLVYIALKGYDHYPCLRKLMRFAAQDHCFDNAQPIVLLGQLLAYVAQSSTGDMDPLPIRWQGVPRFEICASAEDCLRNKCRYYPTCLLHGARRQAAYADIVVTNHALLFCDHLFEGAILPPVAHWVIDEAHAAESEARRQLTVAIEARSLSDVLAQLFGSDGALAYLKTRATKVDGGLLISALVDHARTDAQATEAVASSFFSYLKELVELVERNSYDRVDLWIHAEIRESEAWSRVSSTGAALSKRLETLVKECRDVVSACASYDELLEEQSDLAGLTMRLQEALGALTLVLDGSNEKYVYYAELDRRPNVLGDKLVAAALDVGEILAEEFYPQQKSVIFTSATIATGEDFSYFMRGVGLDKLPPEQRGVLRLESSYDFDRTMTIYLPQGIPEPNTRGYAEALEELLFEVHTAMQGSVLTLFTNRREMERLFERLSPRLAEENLTLKCQFRSTSAKRLRDEFVENEALSLFALRSFWEGFDAPGDTLRCVVIPRLPFGRPNDPLQLERGLREQNAWKRYALPEAIIDLKQAAGRLIRSSSDTGYLVLADARLRTKWYGPNFLSALPSQQQHVLDIQEIAAEMRRMHRAYGKS